LAWAVMELLIGYGSKQPKTFCGRLILTRLAQPRLLALPQSAHPGS